MFGGASALTSRPEKAFTINGFRDWKHATGTRGSLVGHNGCLSHKESNIAWEQYISTRQIGSVADQIDSARAEQVLKNRHYLKTIAVLLCSKQEIAIRGHRESSNSNNKGNFREILDVVAKHDPLVQQRLLHGPRNAVYTSPNIQNTILNIMANIVRSDICESV